MKKITLTFEVITETPEEHENVVKMIDQILPQLKEVVKESEEWNKLIYASHFDSQLYVVEGEDSDDPSRYNKKGFLCDHSGHSLLYTRGIAIKKGWMFKGKIKAV